MKLELEVGKSYVARNGDVVKIVDKTDNKVYPFRGDDGVIYAKDGCYLIDSYHAHQSNNYDLISEYKPVEIKSLKSMYEEVSTELNQIDLVVTQSRYIVQMLKDYPVWRSMDSAPKDGHYCLLAVKIGPFVYTIEGFYYDDRWITVADIEGEILAWMPKIKIPNKFLPWTEEYNKENNNA